MQILANPKGRLAGLVGLGTTPNGIVGVSVFQGRMLISRERIAPFSQNQSTEISARTLSVVEAVNVVEDDDLMFGYDAGRE